MPREGKAALTPASMLGNKANTLTRTQGVIVRGIRDLIAIAPPLIITRDEIDFLFAGIARMLDRLWD